MKKLILTVLFAVLISVSAVFAQSASLLNSQSLNGATGLYSIPTGHVGWEKGGNFGIDFGYRAIINNDDGVSHIPAVTLTFVKMIEISTAFDIQPNHYYYYNDQDNDDLLFGFKVKLPTSKSTAIAIGTNIQLINFSNDFYDYNAYQPYVAITYAGNFFSMNANTTVVFGKTFYSGRPENNSNVDFGMGFDLILFPDVFKNAVHWLIDFSNFGYSDNSWPNDGYHHTSSVWRGILNTGFRIDMSVIPALKKFKFAIDVVFNDLFDSGARSFTLGAVFGFSP
jgi:hypothetical protein